MKERRSPKPATIAATILWVAGFALIFLVPPKSRFVWVSDFLLLAGFLPLLWYCRPGWPWLLFGLLNVIIGFILEIAYVLPDDTLSSSGAVSLLSAGGGMTSAQLTAQMLHVRDHLRDSHSALTWILVGFGAVAFGAFRTTRDIIGFCKKKPNSKTAS